MTTSIDRFAQGYIDAARFSGNVMRDDAEIEFASPDELGLPLGRMADRSLRGYARRFYREHAADIDAASAEVDIESLGSDLWFSREGHGTGFWDNWRTSAQVAEALARLDSAAKADNSGYFFYIRAGAVHLG